MSSRSWKQIGLLLLLVLLPAACGAGEETAGPPEIVYGQDVCDQCNMIINEPRFAAAYVTEDGTAYRFDGIGEMLLHASEHAEPVHAAWVHDFDSEAWVEAGAATYVHNPEQATPMGWGLVAFAEEAAAAAYAEGNGGELLSYGELREAVESGALTPAGMAGHMD